MPLPAIELSFAILVVFGAAVVQGTVGFGLGMLVVPILLLIIDPTTAVMMSVALGLLLSAFIAHQARHHIHLPTIAPITFGGLAAVPLGVIVLHVSSPGALRTAIAALTIIITISLVPILRRPLPRPKLIGPFLGFTVGLFLSGLGVGGPFMAVFGLNQNWPRHTLRGSMALYLFAIAMFSAVSYMVAGLWTAQRLLLFLMLVPAILAGFGVARLLINRISDLLFRRLVIAVILVVSALVLVQELA